MQSTSRACRIAGLRSPRTGKTGVRLSAGPPISTPENNHEGHLDAGADRSQRFVYRLGSAFLGHSEQARDWLSDNCVGWWDLYAREAVFYEEEDAYLFALRFR
jgi:hypothetical protein